MASGGTSHQSSTSQPGTISPITATLLQLFGGNVGVKGGQFQPTTFGQGGLFTPEMFSALPGLLQNQPLNATETGIIGGAQAPAWQAALGSQNFLQQGANAITGSLPALLETNPAASIAAAQRGFTEETIPTILERAPGFSSSDLQRELTRAGTDLQTNIAALKEANLGRVGQTVQGIAQGFPGYAQALGSNLLDQASQNLGFGQIGRQLVTDTSPAGDAFRVLTALQSLVGGVTSRGQSAGQSKQGGVLS